MNKIIAVEKSTIMWEYLRDGEMSKPTARQLQILCMVSSGMSYQRVADRLELQHATVRNHLSAVRYKLGVHSSIAAMNVAISQGWISTEFLHEVWDK